MPSGDPSVGSFPASPGTTECARGSCCPAPRSNHATVSAARAAGETKTAAYTMSCCERPTSIARARPASDNRSADGSRGAWRRSSSCLMARSISNGPAIRLPAHRLALAGLPACEHEAQIAQPVEVSPNLGVHRSLCRFELHDVSFGAPDDRARDIHGRRCRVRTGYDECLGERSLGDEVVDPPLR